MGVRAVGGTIMRHVLCVLVSLRVCLCVCVGGGSGRLDWMPGIMRT